MFHRGQRQLPVPSTSARSGRALCNMASSSQGASEKSLSRHWPEALPRWSPGRCWRISIP